MTKIIIVGLGEAGKSAYKILAPFKQLEVKNIIHPIKKIDSKKKIVYCDKIEYNYDYLIICTGASPNDLETKHPNIKTTRDFNSIQQLATIAKSSNRIAVLGNGGVSLEIVNEFRHLELLWIFRNKHIGKDFFDQETSRYFYPFVFKKTVPNKNDVWAYIKDGESPDLSVSSADITPLTKIKKIEKPLGPALGPVWKDSFRHFVQVTSEFENFRDIKFEPEATVVAVLTKEQVMTKYERRVKELKNGTLEFKKHSTPSWEMNDIMDIQVPPSKIKNLLQVANDALIDKVPFNYEEYPLYLKLSNLHIYGVDYLICGLGVTPNTSFINKEDGIKLSKEGGIIVNTSMKTSVDCIYAAGDVVSLDPIQHNFIQKRLWSQGRIMGITAAKSILDQLQELKYEIPTQMSTLIQFCMLPTLSTTMIDRYFNNFVHVTSFFGLRVVLLGKYNGQGLDHKCDYYTAGNGLIKYVLKDDKVRGALLIGETGMEVLCCNLGLCREFSDHRHKNRSIQCKYK